MSVERLLTAKEVAKKLGVSERWVRDHATRRNPRIPCVPLGSLIRFLESDVESFIQLVRIDPYSQRRRT